MFTKISYSFAGFLLGILLGSLVGLGELNQTKKSIREEAFPVLLIGGGFIGGIVGLSLGYKIGLSKHIDQITGIGTAETNFIKQGRFWIASTVWTDIRNNTTNQILTSKSTHGILISELGDRPIIIHETTSGSKVNIEKYHIQAVKSVFFKIKTSFSESTPCDLVTLFPRIANDKIS